MINSQGSPFWTAFIILKEIKMNKNEIFSKITNAITEKLQTGILPWRKSWKSGIPTNYISKRPYNGMNFISLCLMDYPSQFYLTFLQCREKQGYINKGAEGALVVFWKLLEAIKTDEGNDDVKRDRFPLLRYSYVFNLSQTSLYNKEAESVKIILADNIIANLKDRPVIKNNFRKCFYDPLNDYISLPVITDFNCKEEYYSSLFHELIHWTGNPKRLNRFTAARDKNYKVEELIAELGSSYLCGLAGIEPAVLDNQAAYVSGWLSLLNGEQKYFIEAVNKAKQAVNYILNDLNTSQP